MGIARMEKAERSEEASRGSHTTWVLIPRDHIHSHTSRGRLDSKSADDAHVTFVHGLIHLSSQKRDE